MSNGTPDKEIVTHSLDATTAPGDAPDDMAQFTGAKPAEVQVFLTTDELHANIQVFPPIGDLPHVTVEMIKEALAKRKVTVGVDDEAIRRVVENREYMKTIQVAAGVPPVNGVDASLIFHYSKNRHVQDRSLENLQAIDMKELDNIMNIQFAENARDLGEAISRGDLRENAEYQAAREKQAQLIEKAERLKADLQKIVFIEPYTVKTNIVSPGTKVTIKNKDKETTETYTLLGPWDADIDKNIISYLSPIGKGLLNKKTGETVTIQLPENEIVCDIIKIEKAL